MTTWKHPVPAYDRTVIIVQSSSKQALINSIFESQGQQHLRLVRNPEWSTSVDKISKTDLSLNHGKPKWSTSVDNFLLLVIWEKKQNGWAVWIPWIKTRSGIWTNARFLTFFTLYYIGNCWMQTDKMLNGTTQGCQRIKDQRTTDYHQSIEIESGISKRKDENIKAAARNFLLVEIYLWKRDETKDLEVFRGAERREEKG